MKQILTTKTQIEDAKNKLLIESKIRKLKEEFKRHTSNRIGDMYGILSEIVKLRQGTLKPRGRYTPRSLEWEDDLKLKSYQIRYIFSYEHFSDKSKQLVKEGKIDDASICFLIWRFKILQQTTNQNKVVKMYLDGKIKLSEMGELNEKDLIKSLNLGEPIFKEKERYIISANKSIRSQLSRLKAHDIKKSNSRYKEDLILSLEKFIKYLK